MELPQSPTPLESWCDFVGALGVGRTRASRLAPRATVNVSGVMLHSAIAARLLGGAVVGQAPDNLVAVHLPDMYREIQLPKCLAPLELNEADLRAELRDSLRAARSDLERQAVEVARIQCTALR